MASLLKTPLLIGGFKLAEVEPKILDQELVYNGVPDLYKDQVISVSDRLQIGKTYTIRDLMYRSIIYSDNTAAQILLDYFPEDFLDRIMQALGVQIIKPTGEVEDFVTARSFANIFRILYNASYLTRDYSNQALDILTKTEFNNGIVAKLPNDVTVAHKFAERTLVNDDNSVAVEQIHECGIVYLKNFKDPYVLCILTEGDSYEKLEGVISDLSLSIYEEMIKD
jgi:beta-lactamase class A